MQDKQPKRLRSHRVKINWKVWPPKQAFELVSGLDWLDFTTQEARRVLKALGFRTFEHPDCD